MTIVISATDVVIATVITAILRAYWVVAVFGNKAANVSSADRLTGTG